ILYIQTRPGSPTSSGELKKIGDFGQLDLHITGLPGVVCYLDDILITGHTEIEHWENVQRVLEHLQEHGIRLHQDKCASQVLPTLGI
ncbi:hypothetical protein NFI96_030963, partial [Prochilodus magdalenae]